MNYVIYRFNKIKLWFFCFWSFSILCVVFWNVRKIWFCFRKNLGVLGVFCIMNCYFEYRIRILSILLYLGTWFKNIVWFVCFFFSKNITNVWTIFVRTICLISWGMFGPKWRRFHCQFMICHLSVPQSKLFTLFNALHIRKHLDPLTRARYVLSSASWLYVDRDPFAEGEGWHLLPHLLRRLPAHPWHASPILK